MSPSLDSGMFWLSVVANLKCRVEGDAAIVAQIHGLDEVNNPLIITSPYLLQSREIVCSAKLTVGFGFSQSKTIFF